MEEGGLYVDTGHISTFPHVNDKSEYETSNSNCGGIIVDLSYPPNVRCLLAIAHFLILMSPSFFSVMKNRDYNVSHVFCLVRF